MAQVRLQVVVKRDELNKLQADVNKLNQQKIKIDATPLNRSVQEAEKSTQALLKTQKEQSKAAKEAARAEEALAKAEKAKVSVQTEVEKQTKAGYQAQQAKIRLEREAAKQAREIAKEEENHSKSLDKQGLAYKILGRSVSDFVLRMTAYRAVYAGIRAITNGFTEALQTLKAVDDELVTVRKVTGFDAAQMAGVESQAYAVASKYGASASDYVSGVAAFARAGYKELSGDLAELAQKTMIVGDTTAEVANQFLLSVDAAYKFNGSVTELSKVLDAANELDNKYATSIEKIAEGMGIVAPVAAQMHVDVYELEAAIGTITAVTQRTGTEAARALRAIMLNIVGDTKTEIEEGVTWTTGEIAGLKDVIKQYAPEAYKAAQATGSIIDPMKAIGGLAESFEKGLLTEQKLMEMVSDIGGKLRTSQLLALIQNWDMYNNMLTDTANAAGSADKEIANAMDSWTRKTNVLKNTWTEFIKSGLNSSQIKFFLDALTFIVQHLGTLNGALSRLVLAFAALKLHSTASELTKISKGLIDVEKDASKAAQMFSKFGVSAKTLNGLSAVIGGLALAWTTYSAIRAEIDRKHQERVQAIYDEAKAAQDGAKNILNLYVEMDTAADSASDFSEQAKTLADTLGIDLAEGADKARQKLAELSAEELRTAANKANTSYITALDDYMYQTYGEGSDTYWGNIENIDNLRKHFMGGIPEDLQEKIFEAYSKAPTSISTFDGSTFIDLSSVENALKYRKVLQEIVEIRDEYIRQGGDQEILDSKYFEAVDHYLGETADAFNAVETARKNAIDTQAMEIFHRAVTNGSVQNKKDLDALISGFDGMRDVSDEVKARLIELANEYYDFSGTVQNSGDALNRETAELYANQKALDANATAADKAAAAKKDAEAAVAAHMDALFDETGALTEAGKAALTASKYLADLVEAETKARLEAAQANYANLRAQLAGVTTDAIRAAMALAAVSTIGNSASKKGAYGYLARHPEAESSSDVAYAMSLMDQIAMLEAEISSLSVSATNVSPYTSSYGSSSGKSGRSGGSGGSGSSGRSSGTSSTSSEDKKLTSLKERVSLLKSELSLMQERGDSEEDQTAKMREIMAALSAEADYLKSIKGDQVTINNLYQEWYQYHNKIEDLMNKEAEDAEKQAKALQDALDAQRALENVLNNRNVRIYNSATGQWEWISNPSDVSAAQSKLRDAIANLPADQQSQFAYYLNHTPGGGPMGSTLYDFLPGEIAAALAAGFTGGAGNTNNYGNTYNFGGMTFTQAQANSLTLAQFAQLAGGLSIYNNSP